MNRKKLFNEELSNLYAINKQVNKYFTKDNSRFLSEKHQVLLNEYLNVTRQCEKMTSNILDELDFNPTNTSDSIIEEIIENLANIARMDIDNVIKTPGYLMSINRLISYQLANLENIKYISSDEIKTNPLILMIENLKSIKDKLFVNQLMVKN